MFFHRSPCKAAAVNPVARAVTFPVRRFGCLRHVLAVQGAAGYGLPYAACFPSICGLSHPEGASCFCFLFLPLEAGGGAIVS